MRKIVICFLLLFLAGIYLAPSAYAKRALFNIQANKERGLPSQEETIVFGGRTRTYRIFVPPSLTPGPRALIFVFHGGGGTSAQIEKDYGMDEPAKRFGFILVYPQGLNKHWSDGRPKANPGVDDIGFVRNILDKMSVAYPVDQNKVFACGISNGALFSNHLALHMSNRIHAIASIAGAINTADKEVVPGNPVSVLLIHGTDDDFVPINGGSVKHTPIAGSILSCRETFERWIQYNGGKIGMPVITKIPSYSGSMRGMRPVNIQTPAIVTKVQTRSGAVCESVIIERGGHTWPGHPLRLLGLDGITPMNFDASTFVCEFFNNLCR